MYGYVSFSINIMDKLVRNFIAKSQIIDPSICDEILEETKDLNWVKHSWYSHHNKIEHSHEDKEPDVLHGADVPDTVQEKLIMHINAMYKQYAVFLEKDLGYDQLNMIKYWSPCRINKYQTGSMMRRHYDHIHSLFDGTRRGIPVISVVGCLTDSNEYDGGDIVFFDDLSIKLDKGDILIFPSCFLYPHGVEEITRGERHTFVSWGF